MHTRQGVAVPASSQHSARFITPLKRKIIQLRADIELESKWAERHQQMGRTAQADLSQMRLTGLNHQLELLLARCEGVEL